MSAKTRLAELLAAKRKAREQIAETNPNLSKTELAVAVEDSELAGALSSSSWNWHEDQLRAIQTAVSGKPVAITGPAGSGKTTVEVEIARQLSLSLPAINHNDGHKYITTGAPGMLFVSFTNKAVENTRSKLPSNLRHNAMTIHKLLEFKPVFTEEWDPVRPLVLFEPNSHKTRPADAALKHTKGRTHFEFGTCWECHVTIS